jgi:hypothetical protein
MVQRGDLLLLSLANDRIQQGDICVYKLRGRDIPIVHRVMKVHDEYVFYYIFFLSLLYGCSFFICYIFLLPLLFCVLFFI